MLKKVLASQGNACDLPDLTSFIHSTKENLLQNATDLGDYLYEALIDDPLIQEIRYQGLMFGIELKVPCAPLRNKLLSEFNMLTGNASSPKTLRILPALNITKSELDVFIEAFKILSKSNL